MAKSKLEFYEDIICVLAEKALTIDSIAFECNTSCVLLQDKLEFLEKNNIVNIEVNRNKKAFYVLTRRGTAISKTFIIAKRLAKLQTNAHTSAPASQAVSSLQKRDEEKARAAW